MSDLILKLTKLGFTEPQAKIYVYLLENQGLNGTQISNNLKIPRTTVYQALENLCKIGYICLVPSETEAKNYIPLDPRDVISKLKKEYEEILKNIEQEIESIYRSKNYENSYVISGEDNVRYKIKDMLSQENILISGDITKVSGIKLDGNYKHINETDADVAILVDSKKLFLTSFLDEFKSGIYTENSHLIRLFLKR